MVRYAVTEFQIPRGIKMISKEKIDRINELARKAKSESGLTAEEKEEQALLRREYIDAFKANLRAQLENIEFVEDIERKEGREKDQYVIGIEEKLN